MQRSHLARLSLVLLLAAAPAVVSCSGDEDSPKNPPSAPTPPPPTPTQPPRASAQHQQTPAAAVPAT